MQRREFLKITGSAVAVSMTGGMALADVSQPDRTPRILPLNDGWRYKPADVPGAESPGFDDSSFDKVVLPHSNCSLPWHNFDDKLYEFVSTYRRTFTPPAYLKGKRVFLDFEGAMTSSTVYFNGELLGEYRGGFTPFSFELTQHIGFDKPNTIAVRLDSTERHDIPPFGHEIDYMTFGGIYREVSVRIVPQLFLDNIHARTIDALSKTPALEVDCFLSAPAGSADTALSLRVQLRDNHRVFAEQSLPVLSSSAAEGPAAAIGRVHQGSETASDAAKHTLRLNALAGIELWDLAHPKLYDLEVFLVRNGVAIDSLKTRIGFREAVFTPQGFMLNGKVVKLRGLDRHQTFPFVGQAMPERVQRMDADILRRQLHCNIVRTSHYPQSRHFLDRCDEIGLLVLEEIPGWQHIGPDSWQGLALDNVRRMIQRDWNRPSVILWGVRINESPDNDTFYTRTNDLAHSLDTRQTGGIRNRMYSHLIEDVFTINDFGFPLQPPNHPLYLNTEFVGHTYPTKSTDDDERQREHTLRHARIHNQLASDPRYAGGIGWCAFDYNTHGNFGSGDRICYHGVMDIFRMPKPAAGFYRSQCEPDEEVVLEPAFHWARGDEAQKFSVALFCSNCDQLRVFFRPEGSALDAWLHLADIDPNHKTFPHLLHAPFTLDLSTLDFSKFSFPWGDLRIDGYVAGHKVISKSLSGEGVDRQFHLEADSTRLLADGADATRVTLRVTDEFGAVRTYADAPISFTLSGPGELIGENPFALIGGVGAVWVRVQSAPGLVHLTAKHPRLGEQTVTLTLDSPAKTLVRI